MLGLQDYTDVTKIEETCMKFQTWDNPMGTDGFEFIEFAAPDPAGLGKLFETMGFKPVARHRLTPAQRNSNFSYRRRDSGTPWRAIAARTIASSASCRRWFTDSWS